MGIPLTDDDLVFSHFDGKPLLPKVVQERLGHSSIQITLDTCSHAAPGPQQAAAIRFDEGLKIEPKKEAVENVG